MPRSRSSPCEILDVSALPDDPMQMPPPYWRSTGAIFVLSFALQEIARLLPRLQKLEQKTDGLLNDFFQRHPEEFESQTEDIQSEFSNICDPLWQLETRVKCQTDVSILMAAIESEDSVNQFLVFNLHKEISENVERLGLLEKLLLATAAVSGKSIRGTRVHEGAKALTTWRNAFAHGHCVDRPTKSLRHNHLISPEHYWEVQSSVIRRRRTKEGEEKKEKQWLRI